MKTSSANAINILQSDSHNGSKLVRSAITLVRMAISVFEIRETGSKSLHQVFLPALALVVLCFMSVSTQAASRLAASMNGAQETPPNGSTATGYGSVILSDDQTTITVNMGFTGLTAAASAAHIHTGAPGVAGGVTFTLTGVPAATSGTIPQQTFAISPAQVTALLAGNMYFNIHNGSFPGGEIRGQILTATCNTAGRVEVEATAGTFGPTAYADLTSALTAINAGTHQGAINIEVCIGTTEPAGSAVLNSSGAGSASYTAINIYPLVDALTVSGASATGRGLIELNGADNVMIDGDNPNSGGINRNLTIQNTAANTIAFTSVVRIALATTIVTSADNVTIKNLNLIGNATGRNVAGATSTTGTENSVYGVLATAGASTVSATTAPSAIAAVSTTIGTGATAANLLIDNNSVATCARGIAVQGSATTVFPGLTISNNLIGNATASAVDQVYSVGITAQGSANGSIAGNIVYIESFLPSSTSAANRAIDVGSISATGTFTVERNQVNRAKNNAPDFWVAHGINLAGGTNHVVRNNFVQNITLNTTSGGFYSTTFNAAGIRVAGGTGHQIYHNSVNMAGTITGATPTISAAYMVTATTITGVDTRNNIFVNSLTNGSATSAHVAVYLPSGGTSAMNLTLNNNDYFNGAAPTATQGVGQVGTTAGTGFFTQANFDPSMTTPATNFRSYTSTLSAGGANDNASKKVDPQFLSATDLHIAPASPMVDMGASVGVGNDIDGQSRVPPPDIGADEPGGVTPPANDIAAVALVNPPSGSTRSAGTPFTVQASFSNNGTAAQNNVPVRFKIIDASTAVVYNQTTTIASINPSQTVTATFPNATLPAGAYTTQAIAELVGDQNAGNDSVNGTLTVVNPLSGTVTVGSGGNFPSLTNTGGVFDALNNAGASSNVTINVISDLTGESGTVALNELAGGFTVLIKPSGAARAITGSSTVGIIRINGADGVTIDGSLAGGSATGVGGNAALRNLTVQNTSTAATAGSVIAIQQGANSANNDTVKNVNVSGQDPTQTLVGLHIGGNTVGTAPTVASNNNVVVDNCSFQKSILGIFNDGVSAAIPATGNAVTHNDLSATGASRLRRAGIFLFNHNGIQVTENKIGGIVADESADAIGIIAGIQNITTTAATSGGIFNATISRNRIDVVTSTNTVGFSAAGIAIAGDAAGPNTISNNTITGINAPATSPDIVAGIFVAGVTGSNTKLYHNSVSLTGDRGAVASQIGSYGIAISGTDPIVDSRDNIFYTTQTSGGGANAKSYAIGMQTTTFANLTSNFNDFFFSGANAAGFRTGSLDTSGTDLATLAAWQTATTKDGNSFSVDPVFVDPIADVHLLPASTLLSAGTSPALVANDIDNDPRPLNPDIGADELVQATGGSFAAGTYYNASAVNGDSLGGNVTITNAIYLNGILSTGANTLTIGCTAFVSGASATNYVIGNLARVFCATGGKAFDVGTANGYSPVNANSTAGTFPSTLTVKATQGPQPSVNPAKSIQRYWTLTETGDITATLTFQYLVGDVPGTSTEANYKVIRVVGTTPVSFPASTVNTINHTATLAGVSNFSDWTVGEIAAPTAAPATISGQVTTTSGAPLAGVPMFLSGARQARAITDANGNYRFMNIDTDNFYTVTPGLVNYHFSPASRSLSLLANVTDAVFTANRDAVSGGNVIDTPEYFVRQHYLDFLGREPDSAGLNFWSEQIAGCGNDFNCIERRTINVSAAYFLSIEFQETGGLVDGLYRASYARAPLYAEFMPDTARVARNVIVGETGWQRTLATNKQEFLDAWVERAAFHAAYDNLGNDGYVDALIGHTGVTFTDSERAALVSGLNAGTLTRAGVLGQVAENERFVAAKFNEAFVRMQYFGYLRRDPDDSGFHFWLNKLNEFGGNFERAEMVKAFIVSTEYRDRFRQ